MAADKKSSYFSHRECEYFPCHPGADPEQAERWLRLAGCETIFHVSSYTGEGVWRILEYLREEGETLPWETEQTDGKKGELV